VAAIVNSAIDIYKRIDQTNWGDFGAAVAAVGAIAEGAVSAVEIGVTNFGGPEAKSTLSEVESFIKGKWQKAEQLRGNAAAIWEGIKVLKEGRAEAFAAALANGLPATIVGTGLRMDLGDKSIEFKDPRLQRTLRELYENGRFLLNDAEARAGASLAGLASIPSAELAAKLEVALKGAVRELPPDIKGQAEGLKKIAKEDAERALGELSDHVRNGMSDDTRRLLAQALEGGMLFVKTGEVVVAVERPIEGEAKAFQARLEAYTKRVQQGTIGGFIEQLTKLRDDLTRKGDAMARESNDTALIQLARVDVPASILRVETELQGLRGEIPRAREDLSDREDERKIFNYEAEATRKEKEASGLVADQAELRARRAGLIIKQAKLAAEMELLRGEQAENLLAASEVQVRKAEEALQFAFDRCLADGVDPLSPGGIVPMYRASLQKVLFGYRTAVDVANRAAVASAATQVFGMIQWCGMLGLAGDLGQTPADYYTRLVTVLGDNVPSWSDGGGRKDSIGGRLQALADDLDALFREKAGLTTSVPPPAGGEIVPDQILWRDANNESAFDGLLRDENPVYRPKVIGLFRFRMDVGSLPPATRLRFPPPKILPDEEACYIIDLNKIFIINSRPNLYFFLVPPATSYTRLARPHAFGPLRIDGQIDLTEPFDIYPTEFSLGRTEEIIKDLGVLKGKNFTGALGEWTFLVMAADAKTLADRAAVIKEIQDKHAVFDLQMYYLKVKAKPSPPSVSR
jgi:hypothetical protein